MGDPTACSPRRATSLLLLLSAPPRTGLFMFRDGLGSCSFANISQFHLQYWSSKECQGGGTCILEQLELDWDSKFSEEEGDNIYWVAFICFSWLRASKQEGKFGHSINTSCQKNPGGFKTQVSSFICHWKSTPSNSTTAARNWLSLALEGRALQTAPTASTTLCSQVVSPPCTQTCLTLLSKHNMAKVMRIMLQAEKWIHAVPHAVIFYYLKCQVSLHYI